VLESRFDKAIHGDIRFNHDDLSRCIDFDNVTEVTDFDNVGTLLACGGPCAVRRAMRDAKFFAAVVKLADLLRDALNVPLMSIHGGVRSEIGGEFAALNDNAGFAGRRKSLN
jgi:hypothetical protein